MRTVNVRPGPPTFVAAIVATALSKRSFCGTLAEISKFVTCHIGDEV
jgi:hypothetical protein